jgi:hypothetical protein
MQFQVPQFIESEDKLVGPFTLRQFAYVAGAAAIGAMLYFTIGGVVSIIVGALLIASALGFAFVKVGGRPLIEVFLAAINFYWKPQTYVWRAERAGVSAAPSGRKASQSPVAAAIEKIASGVALHKSWEDLQTGTKISDKEFLEKKMEGRYQIFQRKAGDKAAARRIDYR